MSAVRLFLALGCGAIVSMALLAMAPARADDVFVRCQFRVAKPFLYPLDGAQHVGSRLDVSNCETNLDSAPLQFDTGFLIQYGTQNSPEEAITVHYYETRDVHNGDSFSVAFPYDDQVLPLRPGVYIARATVSSTIEGFEHPKFIEAQSTTWS